jgi:DNA (cytosine-5)-methyltransferase 1
MRVADFFCGAGGFSEGFRQMGFDVVFGLDNWKPAIDTIKLNHPGIDARCLNIHDVDTPEKIDEIIPDTEIIIGSPPCVAFSGSNKAGKADKSPGIRLIEQFLKIIAWKKNKPNSILKYWILENVPNSIHFIRDKYTFKELGLTGGKKITLRIKQKDIFNSADYGTPQGRMRMFCGEYPTPKKTHDENNWVYTSKVLESLTNPLKKNDIKIIKDPCYDYSIKRYELTDHFYDTRVADWEWKRAKRLKEDHGYMGKMSFPENLERTSRTIMATQSASTREAMIFGAEMKDDVFISYRMPTIREIASIMSFPLSYQFEANSESSKYRLVGNAVCPLESRAFAKAILDKKGIRPQDSYLPQKKIPKPKKDLTGMKRKLKPRCEKSWSSRYSRHIPYLKVKGFRVELDNRQSDFKVGDLKWSCVLHYGTGKTPIACECDNKVLERILKKDQYINLDTKEIKRFKMAIKDITDKVPEAKTLQDIYCNTNGFDEKGPDEILYDIRSLLDKHFPKERFGKTYLKNYNNAIEVPREDIPLRIVMGQYALNEIVDKINRS